MYMERPSDGELVTGDPSASWSQIALFASAVEARLGKWLADNHNLGLTEYRALVLLSRAPDRELRVNDLAQQVGLNQSSVTRLLGRLEAKSLTYRDVCPEDGRGVYAVLADPGRAALRESRAGYEAKVAEVLVEVADLGAGINRRQVSDALAVIGGLLAT
ncbi:MarR family winged helix-turn-helix transcriptional regulator [Salinispora cortesiana]|uniref:MarR family winged helix-turn-helix transcriptional regulator n=1 Tax=Salinispora cortesiana TaxID=1305843 RepID=UPI0003F4EECC|nr:MarR family transcriptional regulator [Salinispora cortesiana]